MASTLTVDNIVGATSASAVHVPGSVIQVVEGSYNTQTDISSGSYVDSGLSVIITPKFSSSKVYVITNLQTFINGVGIIGVNIVRGSTSILTLQNAAGYQDNSADVVSLTKLDSPATTSATTYKVQVNQIANSGTLRINQNGGSRITVMEIAQ
tara:strand:- start:26 stop:484 length:459 start_codon:yes stop_codon:yes gene_type:complete